MFEPFFDLESQGYQRIPKEEIIINRRLLNTHPDCWAAASTKVTNHLACNPQFHYSFNNQTVPHTEEWAHQFSLCVRNLYFSSVESGFVGLTTGRDERLDKAREARKLSVEKDLREGRIDDGVNHDNEDEDDVHFHELVPHGKSFKHQVQKKGKIKRKFKERIQQEEYDDVYEYLDDDPDDSRPICIDLTLVDIYYKPHRDPSKWQFRVFEPTDRTMGFDSFHLFLSSSAINGHSGSGNNKAGFLNYRELHHIKIYMIYPLDPLTNTLQSPISRCRDAIRSDQYMQLYTEMAIQANACPILPLEHITTPADQKKQDRAGIADVDPGYGGNVTTIYDTVATIDDRVQDHGGGFDPVKHALNVMAVRDQDPNIIKQFKSTVLMLPENKKISSFTTPIEPSPVMDFKLHVKQLIFAQFGFPYQLALAFAPLQGGSTPAGGGVGGAQSQKSTTMPAQIYAQNIKSERRWITYLLQELLDKLTYIYRLADISIGGVPNNSRIIISLPGIPPDEQVTQDYLSGGLKYDAYTRIKCELHDYRPADWYTQAERELNVKELNGIQEEESEPPKKKKKKSSSK